MRRPHIYITMHMGYISKVYPNMQWNENTSQRKMLADLREWLHNHHPSWRRAMVYLDHYKGSKTHSDTIHITRGQAL